MNKMIYTIGYSSFKIEEFIKILKNYKINGLIDVRSNPNSKFYTDYNLVNLQKTLQDNNIIYRNYKNEFGARQENASYFDAEGYLSFKKFVKSDAFLNGVNKIQNSVNQGYIIAIMCAEKDPINCHRNIMVARELNKLGFDIRNIIHDGTFETQDIIDKRMVDKYFPNRNQVSLFDDNLTWEEMVDKSYEYRNSEIGYRINNSDFEEEI